MLNNTYRTVGKRNIHIQVTKTGNIELAYGILSESEACRLALDILEHYDRLPEAETCRWPEHLCDCGGTHEPPNRLSKPSETLPATLVATPSQTCHTEAARGPSVESSGEVSPLWGHTGPKEVYNPYCLCWYCTAFRHAPV